MSCSCNFGAGASVCHCAACHETFTAVTAFDLHQRLDASGRNVCLVPAYSRNKKGVLVFKVVRLTPDVCPVWGTNRPDLAGADKPWATCTQESAAVSAAA